MNKNLLLRLPAALFGVILSSCSAYTLVDSQTYNDADLADYSTFRIYYPTDGADLPPGMDMVTYYNIAAAVREQMMERGFIENANSPMVVNLAITVKRELSTAPLSSVLPPPAPFSIPLSEPGPVIITRPTPPPPSNPGPASPDASPTPQLPPQTSSARDIHYFRPTGLRPIPVAQPYFMYPRFNYWNSAALSDAQVVTGVYREGVLTMDIFNIDTKTALFSSSVATILDSGDTQFRDLKGIAQAVSTLFSKFPIAPPSKHHK